MSRSPHFVSLTSNVHRASSNSELSLFNLYPKELFLSKSWIRSTLNSRLVWGLIILIAALPYGASIRKHNLDCESQSGSASNPLYSNLQEDDRRLHDMSSECPVESKDTAEYIVGLKSYAHAAEHEAALRQHIDQSYDWSVLPRHNPASQFPTDFLLIKVPSLSAKGHGSSEILEAFRKAPNVKYVTPQRRLTNTLKEVMDSEPAFDNPMSWKGTGRKFSWAEKAQQPRRGTDASDDGDRWGWSWRRRGRRLLGNQVTALFHAEKLWEKGFTGAGVKIAIFDTGLRQDHPHFRKIMERSNWTDEDTLDDGLGHGTFVAGVIASQNDECSGFAPDVDIHVFRVFTNAQVSYTSWFLDAFNYAMHTHVNILNLSIGGPDFMDRPFVEKVWEMSANNIIVVSAIGNDGPLYGTLNNPADQADVIGVGGIDFDDSIAPFSSRGMTTWELPSGYGRPKPDLVAYGRNVYGSRIHGSCRSLSGTSVASPVVAGAVALLASVPPLETRWKVLNPASMKQALVEGAKHVPNANIFEQGSGRLDLLASYEILKNYTPKVSLFPAHIDLTEKPYMWPYSTQPLYYSAQPIIFNATILNGMSLIGRIASPPVWSPSPTSQPNMLHVAFTYSEVVWPWAGHLAIHMTATEEAANWEGEVEGTVHVTVVSPAAPGEGDDRIGTASLTLKVKIIPKPPREKRLLWDVYHNLQYPPGYIPRDSLTVKDDILDWNGDHPHTNYRRAYAQLKEAGFFVETLGTPLTCFDAENYAALMIIDEEDEFYPEEVAKLKQDVLEKNLSLIIFADWYNPDVVHKLKFFDENTRSWWTPITGGSNVPALNDLLLDSFGIAFGEVIYTGKVNMGQYSSTFASGTSVVRFPKGGNLHFLSTVNDQSSSLLGRGTSPLAAVPVTGTVQTENPSGGSAGRIFVHGDSNCLDESHMETDCFWLLLAAVQYAKAPVSSLPFEWPFAEGLERLIEPYEHHKRYTWAAPHLPLRPVTGLPHDPTTGVHIDNDMHLYSRVLKNDLTCPAPINPSLPQQEYNPPVFPKELLQHDDGTGVSNQDAEIGTDQSRSSEEGNGTGDVGGAPSTSKKKFRVAREFLLVPVLVLGGILFIAPALLRIQGRVVGSRKPSSVMTPNGQSSAAISPPGPSAV
mmetsp:Transcript_42834/g.71281  ORF Transcript_42834/g.71281 Transcript_42834/m.71281 type:complete len:1139 (+) Transcript_42834:55-3471(+)|eukprot:CAMPEP_0184372480 /NCGR_PEP_ID=MMETSP1089-20130417/163964_1 /TAXON_ID=38269 ORGANISM="Gloeochaete wittrockiana, Strain SAG46.84" /NCGR_SAMPLE_ID=MMETSP1089 /ASSEMBLY_ACC=CAM_ASM_000445 /LENGTH=1138 /DNA_ID=CAMNT_0026715325 /DNA_START=53 /DNA_END=3469 /DNA_ORIENTATION=+